jgi:hypothetical protein
MTDDSSEEGRGSRGGTQPGERSVISRKELHRQLMREARRRAYAQAKAKRQQDPRYLAMKEAAKLRRREEYRRAKALRAEAEQSKPQRSKPQRSERGESSTSDSATRQSSSGALSPRVARLRAQREAAETQRVSEAVAMRRAEPRVSKQQQLAELRAKLERALAPTASEVANDVSGEPI